MSTIKPVAPSGVGAILPGASVRSAAPGSAADSVGPTTRLAESSGIVAALRAGALSPEQAVSQLTELAVASSGASPAARTEVERRVKALLASDPNLSALLARMGVAISDG